MSCGIYKMTNNINNKIYIGLSVCIETRMYNHFWSAKHTTSNEYDSYLCRAIRKYGEEAFSYEIIEECAVSELAEKERYWIAFYNSTNQEIGYNISSGGDGNSNWSDEDTEYLINHYALGLTALQISVILNRSESSIENRIHYLGLKSPKYWSENELLQLEELVEQNKTPIEISRILDRTVSSVVHQMKRKDLKRKHYWTKEEELLLIDFIEKGYKPQKISELLGRSTASISTKRWRIEKEYGLNERNG